MALRCPGDVADDVGRACFGQAKALAELGKGQVLFVAQRDSSARPEPPGCCHAFGEPVHEPARALVALLGTGDLSKLGEGLGDGVAELLADLVAGAHLSHRTHPAYGRLVLLTQIRVGGAQRAR